MVSWTYFLGYNKIDVVHDIVQSDMDQDADVTNNRLKVGKLSLPHIVSMVLLSFWIMRWHQGQKYGPSCDTAVLSQSICAA
jgi:hypothetical protein